MGTYDVMSDVTVPGTHMPVLMWVSGIYDLWGQTQPFKEENVLQPLKLLFILYKQKVK